MEFGGIKIINANLHRPRWSHRQTLLKDSYPGLREIRSLGRPICNSSSSGYSDRYPFSLSLFDFAEGRPGSGPPCLVPASLPGFSTD